MTKILMSAENPNGYKLEELMGLLISDMLIKTGKIAENTDELSGFIMRNNLNIIHHLARVRDTQMESLKALSEKAPDEGPTGKARI